MEVDIHEPTKKETEYDELCHDDHDEAARSTGSQLTLE